MKWENTNLKNTSYAKFKMKGYLKKMTDGQSMFKLNYFVKRFYVLDFSFNPFAEETETIENEDVVTN